MGPYLFGEEIDSSQSGGKNLALLSAPWMAAVMTPKPQIWLDHPTLPGSAEKKGVPWAQRPLDDPGLMEVQKEETVMLAIILQWCAI